MADHYVGPINLDFYNADIGWAGDIAQLGTKRMVISGLVLATDAEQLQELITNYGARISWGSFAGLLDVFWSAVTIFKPYNGWYLYDQCDVSAIKETGPGQYVNVTVSGLFVPASRIVYSHSGRPKPNPIGASQRCLLVEPLAPRLAGGDPFEIDPGTQFSRQYCPTTIVSLADVTGDTIRMYEGTLT